jgi:hypothetical protein
LHLPVGASSPRTAEACGEGRASFLCYISVRTAPGMLGGYFADAKTPFLPLSAAG